jgi:hypothetical protein
LIFKLGQPNSNTSKLSPHTLSSANPPFRFFSSSFSTWNLKYISWAIKTKVGTKQSKAVAQEKMADLNHQRKSGGFGITKPHVFKKITSWGHWLAESRNILKYNRVNSNPPFPAWVAAVVKQSSIF